MTYPDRIDSKFRYVLLAANRAEQLMRGAQPKLAKAIKPTSLAMEEVQRDMVEWDYGLPEPPPAADDGGEEAAEESAAS